MDTNLIVAALNVLFAVFNLYLYEHGAPAGRAHYYVGIFGFVACGFALGTWSALA